MYTSEYKFLKLLQHLISNFLQNIVYFILLNMQKKKGKSEKENHTFAISLLHFWVLEKK